MTNAEIAEKILYNCEGCYEYTIKGEGTIKALVHDAARTREAQVDIITKALEAKDQYWRDKIRERKNKNDR